MNNPFPPRIGPYLHRQWRTGRKNRRVVYAIVTEAPTDHDPMIGAFDSPTVAAHVCTLHNADLERRAEE